MLRQSKEEYFIRMLELVCSRSTCLRRSVGAIVTDAAGHVLSTGYNGTPAGFEHCAKSSPCPGWQDQQGDTRRCLAVHAEQNALLQCQRLDLAHTMYVSCCPCFTCAKMILNTSIQRVVAVTPYTGDGGQELLAVQRKLYYYDFETSKPVAYSPV